MFGRFRSAVAVLIASLMLSLAFLARAQESGPRFEVGIVYYADGGSFKALDKEAVAQKGRGNYSARIKGAHAAVRLPADHPQIFRVCGVDPTRFKLYRFKPEANARTLTIAKINVWIGGSKTVLSESEIPVTIQTAEGGCFTLTPKTTLGNGEFGVSPVESLDAFMFGVGDVDSSR